MKDLFNYYLEAAKAGDVTRKAEKHKDPEKKFDVVMGEWKKGKLHSGRGKKGKKGKLVPKTEAGAKQAVAIAASVAGTSK